MSEIELNFTDVTMAGTDGVFEEVNKLMSSEFTSDGRWMLRTEATIISKFGVGEVVLSLFHDKKVYIVDYEPSIGDVYYNPDIPALSQWSQQSGWRIPQPHVDLIKIDQEFWKHFYDTLIIDSDYFDKIYGKRVQLEK
ncbi:MAG: hypothetical protein J7L15_05920 [Clostridiales bacterium]|nr:hypothetical protein [Clostridiales bacterium]